MAASELMDALKQFDMVEANIIKLEKIWNEISTLIPEGIEFVDENIEYENLCKYFMEIYSPLPKIDGWKPEITLLDYNEIGQARLDYREIGVMEWEFDTSLKEPGRIIRDYRYRWSKKRRQLTHAPLIKLIECIDKEIQLQGHLLSENGKEPPPMWDNLREYFAQAEVLLGSAPKPLRWGDMKRHLYFGEAHDFRDIIDWDWPQVKVGLNKYLHNTYDPLPVDVKDLADLVASKPSGKIITKLNWSQLTPESFERLIFSMVTQESSTYENVEWLTHVNAPDQGRDISAMRINKDPLNKVQYQRVIIQCRHLQSKSINLEDITVLKGQMNLWNNPVVVDILIIATSGRFTTDAVRWVEEHNSRDRLRIDLWPESHLEGLLIARPSLIAEFNLR